MVKSGALLDNYSCECELSSLEVELFGTEQDSSTKYRDAMMTFNTPYTTLDIPIALLAAASHTHAQIHQVYMCSRHQYLQTNPRSQMNGPPRGSALVNLLQMIRIIVSRIYTNMCQTRLRTIYTMCFLEISHGTYNCTYVVGCLVVGVTMLVPIEFWLAR